MEDKSMTAAPLKTSEAIAAESRQMLEKSGMNLAKLAEPLIKASCRTGKNGEACFSEERFVDVLHLIATMVLSRPIDIQVKTHGFEKIF